MLKPQILANLVSCLRIELEKVGKTLAQMQSLHELEIERKSDRSLVCNADKWSHAYLRAVLQTLTPEIQIVSEEDMYQTEPTDLDCKYCWIVDPLDGTSGYLKGRKEFTINVALLYRRKPVIGLLHAPATGETLSGWQFDGLAHGDKGNREVSLFQSGIKIPLLLSSKPKTTDSLTIVCSRRRNRQHKEQLQQLWPNARFKVQDAATKFMTVIKNEADLYLQLHPTKVWDTAAAQVLLENLGGRFYHLDGTAYDVGNLLADNPAFFAVRSDVYRYSVASRLKKIIL